MDICKSIMPIKKKKILLIKVQNCLTLPLGSKLLVH